MVFQNVLVELVLNRAPQSHFSGFAWVGWGGLGWGDILNDLLGLGPGSRKIVSLTSGVLVRQFHNGFHREGIMLGRDTER